jgi:hypothetical protein
MRMRSITCRGVRLKKFWSIATMAAMLVTSGGPMFSTTAQAQTAPVGAGFTLNAGDLRFIFRQIEIAQSHSAGTPLFPNLIPDPRLPFGLRAVDGFEQPPAARHDDVRRLGPALQAHDDAELPARVHANGRQRHRPAPPASSAT